MPCLKSRFRQTLTMLPAIILMLALAASMAPLPAHAQAGAATGRDIDWEKYMQKAANATAIALALSFVDNCSNRLKISETSEVTNGEGMLTLSFGCEGGDDEEAGAFVKFWQSPEGVVFNAIDFAG